MNEISILNVWLHGYKYQGWGDIDIVVSKNIFTKINNIIVQFSHNNSYKVLQIFHHEYCAKYFVLAKLKNNVVEYLILDICSDYVRNGRIWIRDYEFLNNRTNENGFYRPTPSIESEYIFLKHSLKKKWEKHHLDDFRDLYLENVQQIKSGIIKHLNTNLTERFIKYVEDNDLEKVNGTLLDIRKSILLDSFIKNPWNYFFFKIKNVARIINRIFNPTGLHIVIIGTDGSGKSTIVTGLSNFLAPSFRQVKTYHLKPPIIEKYKKSTLVVTEPHKHLPRNTVLSLLKLAVYLVNYVLGFFINILPKKLKSTLIVFDRYYYDLMVDQKRFRMKLPKSIIKFFYYIVPKPELVFFLKTNPQIAMHRKNELNIAELERQNLEFELLKNTIGSNFYVIENNLSVDAAVDKIINIVFNFLEARLNTR